MTLGLVGTLALAGSAVDRRIQDPPYLPKPAIPENASNDPLLQMEISSVRTAEVPARSQVGIAPYASALIIGTSPIKFRSRQGTVLITRLPTLTLVTADPVERVLAFYEQQLRGWSHAEILGGHYFWPGEEEFNPVQRMADTTEFVHVRTSRPVKLVPEARTEIHIRYHPTAVHTQYDPGGSSAR